MSAWVISGHASKRMNPNCRAAGVRRRVIEGEGLGASPGASVNDTAEGLFRVFLDDARQICDVSTP